MPKKWRTATWMRQLPKPIRNGRFYRLGHHVAVILAGHAHNDGTGITVSMKTLAEESWCTLAEAEEALGWLEDEKWFVRTDGPKGPEWVCNFEITRDSQSEIDERLERKRALGRARWHRFQEAKKAAAGVSEVRESALVGCVSEQPELTHPTNELTQATNATNAPNSRNSVSGRVSSAGQSPASPLKSHEEKEEDPKTRSAVADAPLTLVDVAPSQPKKSKAAKTTEPRPDQVLAQSYYDALDGNTNFLAVRAIIKAALAKKYDYDWVKRGVDSLAENPRIPFTKQTLWSAMNDLKSKSRFKVFQSVDHDYTDHGGFGA